MQHMTKQNNINAGIEDFIKIINDQEMTIDELKAKKNLAYRNYNLSYSNKFASSKKTKQNFILWRAYLCADIVCDVCELSNYATIDANLIEKLYKKEDFDNIFQCFDTRGYQKYKNMQNNNDKSILL